MRLLLDTPAALWWHSGDERLGARAAHVLEQEVHEVLLSAVVTLEISIKRALGKLQAPVDLVDDYLAQGATELPVRIEHAKAVEQLEAHHGDPFDRLLIAQAQLEGAVVLTRDAVFARYGVPTLWS